MPRRRKAKEPILQESAPPANTLENITNLPGQIITRSRRKALESIPFTSNVPEARPGPSKRTKPNRGGKGPSKSPTRKHVAKADKQEVESHNRAGDPSSGQADVTAPIPSEDQVVLEQYRSMQKVLGSKCLDVVARMKLDYTPRCVQNREFCRMHHWEKSLPPPLANKDIISKALHFLEEDRHPHFIKFVEDMCIRGEFPGANIITHIWELILTVYVPDFEQYTSGWIIDECVFLFDKIISKFPPCWCAIRESYFNLLTTPINAKNILPTQNVSQQTILQFIISKLAETLKEEPKPELNITREEYFNFHQWERENMCKHNMEAFSRDEKLDRLFVILQQITKVLEMDLAIWILRYIANPKKHLLGTEKPLISSVFGFDQYTQITNLVKQTLEVYVNCVCFSFTPDQIAHITRLVSLLSIVINLFEKSTTKGLKYPNIGKKTEEFTKEIFKMIDGLVGRSIEHISMIISNTEIPFVKYILIDLLLIKLDGDRQEMSAKKILDSFRKQSWLKCELADKEFSPPPAFPALTVEGLKYPTIPKKIAKLTSTVIYRDVYLNLLLTALKAYCDVYAIKDIAKLFTEQKPNERTVPKKNSPRKVVVPKLDLSKIEDDISSLETTVDLKQEILSEPDELSTFEGIHIDADVMKLYRSELKCLLILKKNIPVLREKHGSIFDEFYNFTQKELFENDFSS